MSAHTRIIHDLCPKPTQVLHSLGISTTRHVRSSLKSTYLHAHRILCTTLLCQMLPVTYRIPVCYRCSDKCSNCLVRCGHFEFGESGDQPFGWALDVDFLNEIAPHLQKHSPGGSTWICRNSAGRTLLPTLCSRSSGHDRGIVSGPIKKRPSPARRRRRQTHRPWCKPIRRWPGKRRARQSPPEKRRA